MPEAIIAFRKSLSRILTSVLEELVSNIIIHGFDDDETHEISVSFAIKDKLAVEISDDRQIFQSPGPS